MVLEVKNITLITPEDKLLLKKMAIIFKMVIVTTAVVILPVLYSLSLLAKGNLFGFLVSWLLTGVFLFFVMLLYIKRKFKVYIESLPAHISS